MIPNELIEYYESLVKGQGSSPSEDRLISICELTWSNFKTFGKNEPYCGSYDTVPVWRFAAVESIA